MASGDFLAGLERKFVHKLPLKVLKKLARQGKAPLSQILALSTIFILNLAHLPKRLANPEVRGFSS
jgi:hypothetical protein